MFGKEVRVMVVDTDRYGRTVGRVYADAMDVNAEMVRQGAAWVYRKYSHDRSLLLLEQAVQTMTEQAPRSDSPAPSCSLYVLTMAAANASARGQRVAILASPLHELTGFCLAVDCLNPECRRDRMFAVTELAEFYGRQRRMRSDGCCGRVAASAPKNGVALHSICRERTRGVNWIIEAEWQLERNAEDGRAGWELVRATPEAAMHTAKILRTAASPDGVRLDYGPTLAAACATPPSRRRHLVNLLLALGCGDPIRAVDTVAMFRDLCSEQRASRTYRRRMQLNALMLGDGYQQELLTRTRRRRIC